MGCIAEPTGRLGPEVRHRVGSASTAFVEFRQGVFASSSFSTNTKKQLARALLHSRMLHASESWSALPANACA
eukprot:357698-Lingulodinium_polyedra.AAC.1